MATVTTKEDGTQKRVAINGDVQLKSTYSVSKNTKERPAVKLLSCCFVEGAMTFKVRVSNIYVWLQKGEEVKGFHGIKFVEPVRNYDKYDENWDKKSINEVQFSVAKKFLLTTDLKKLYWEDLETILSEVGKGVDASDSIRKAIHNRNEEEKAERLAKDGKSEKKIA